MKRRVERENVAVLKEEVPIIELNLSTEREEPYHFESSCCTAQQKYATFTFLTL
jgi:hypothetical protein